MTIYGGDDMPEYPVRRRSLTDEDVEAIAAALKTHTVCNMNFTPEEVSTVKRILKAFDKASSIVGSVVLTAIVLTLIAIFTKGFWVSLISGIKAAK
jgi:hypothetical protein